MSREISETADTVRERIILFLALLTSEEIRQSCESVLPSDRLAYEWCRLWFDEVYTPSTQYLDGIKGDRSEETVARFRGAFTDDELAALERFHRFLELRVDMLPDEAHQHNSFPRGDAWEAVVRHATYLLEELHSDPDALQQKLTGMVQTRARQETSNRSLDAFHEVLSPPSPKDGSD